MKFGHSPHPPQTHPDQPVLGLVLLQEVHGVINEGEPCGLATPKVSPEAKAHHHISSGLVHLSQHLPQLRLGHSGSVWVQHIHHLQTYISEHEVLKHCVGIQ